MNLPAKGLILFLLLQTTLKGKPQRIAGKNEDLLKYFHSTETKINLNNFKNTSERILEHGYPVETHEITTKDGYVLNIFRIPHAGKHKNQSKANTKRPIVLLQHGLFSSSDSWLLVGPNNGLPFMLADAGYDVWLGNSRGNIYGRRHTNISLYSANFWHFSWHEIGHHDLPAIIDYALDETKEKSLHYIGYSQGTTACLVMLSTLPAYNAKIRIAHLLAPVAYARHMDDKLVRTLAPLLGRPATPASKFFAGQEFLPQNRLFVKLSYNICNSTATTMPSLCNGIAFLLEGEPKNFNKTAVKELSKSHPAGCSSNQIIHYMQEQQNGRFCAFDFGSKQNLKHYAQNKPPDYELSNIKTTLHLWYGDSDQMSTWKDVSKLAEAIPKKILHHMEDPKWAHGHFVLSNALRKQIHEPIISTLKEHDENYFKI